MTNKYLKSWERWAKLWDPLLSLASYDLLSLASDELIHALKTELFFIY